MSFSRTETDPYLNILGAMPLSDALSIVQKALLQINAQLSSDSGSQLGIRLKSADLSLKTMLGAEVDLEAKIAVVTVTGSAAVQSTSTLAISLQPPTPKPIKGLLPTEAIDPVSNLVNLSNGLFEIVQDAMVSPSVPLELKEGTVTIDLVVNAKAGLEIAPGGFWKQVLSALGIEGSAKAAGEFVSTSSISLSFESI